jgi:hypothetical protein
VAGGIGNDRMSGGGGHAAEIRRGAAKNQGRNGEPPYGICRAFVVEGRRESAEKGDGSDSP